MVYLSITAPWHWLIRVSVPYLYQLHPPHVFIPPVVDLLCLQMRHPLAPVSINLCIHYVTTFTVQRPLSVLPNIQPDTYFRDVFRE